MSEYLKPMEYKTDQPVVVVRVPPEIEELRRLLEISNKDRQSDWQTIVESKIIAICGDFLKQESDDVALSEIVLVALAVQKGSKEAKKRHLKWTRWISTTPGSISDLFDSVAEGRAAIQVLQQIRSEWVEPYICRELAKNKWPELSLLLVEWLLKSTSSVEKFVMALSREVVDGEHDQNAWIPSALESATKLLGSSELSAGAGLMSEVAELLYKTDSHRSAHSNLKSVDTSIRVRGAVLSLLTQVATFEPSVLTQGAVPAVLTDLYSSDCAKRIEPTHDFDHLCRKTLSLFAILLPNADEALRGHYRNIWSTYKKISPRSDKLIENAMCEYQILGLLRAEDDVQPDSEDLGLTTSVEGVLCELMVNWDDYYALHLADPAAQQLASRIDELSSRLGVIRFGRSGDVVPFDPLRHFLAGLISSPPSKVVILRPGIEWVRKNGTARVLLMAAASPCRAE